MYLPRGGGLTSRIHILGGQAIKQALRFELCVQKSLNIIIQHIFNFRTNLLYVTFGGVYAFLGLYLQRTLDALSIDFGCVSDMKHCNVPNCINRPDRYNKGFLVHVFQYSHFKQQPTRLFWHLEYTLELQFKINVIVVCNKQCSLRR